MSCLTNKPFLSVVTVVYNDREGLARTRRSVVSQYLDAVEWVVVDGGSSDGTADDLGADSHPGLRWVSERDRGIYDAMNKGVRMATGDFVVFLNAGDEFAHPKVLDRVAGVLRSADASPDVLLGGATIRLPNGVEIYWRPHSMTYVRHSIPANHQATFFRRESILPEPYDSSYRVCGDYYVIARLSLNAPRVVYLDEAVAVFSAGGTSTQRPGLLLWECLRVQREVLRMPWSERARSAVRRAVNMTGVRVLSQPALAWLGRWVAQRMSRGH